MNIHRLSAALVACAAGSTLLLSATTAGAAVAGPHGHTGGREAAKLAAVLAAAPRLPSTLTLPRGYTVVTADFTAFAGSQDVDTAWCPGTKQPVGGGAVVASSDLQVNINRSYPDGGGWTVSISNGSAVSTDVTAGYSTGDAWLAMNSSAPDGPDWVVYENNGEDIVRSLGAAVICAGT